ncbi:Uncharacterised protein [Bordetella pertussis]|nr:Uncharacterised protein [Bordetella pertussis]
MPNCACRASRSSSEYATPHWPYCCSAPRRLCSPSAVAAA